MSSVQELLNPSFTEAATICSILPREDGQDHTVILRTHGAYFVYHPREGERYKVSHVGWKRDYADVGDYDPEHTRKTGMERRKEFTFDAKQIADDICKQINDNGPGDGSFFGVFVCKGNEPTEQELKDAEARLEKYFLKCIAAADAQWSSAPRHDLISGVARRGVRFLNLDPDNYEWVSSTRKTVECPACSSRIKPGVAVCISCGAILDREKAEKFGLVEREKREPKPKTI